MVDVGRQDSTSARYLVSHKLRSYVGLDAQFLTVHVLTYGGILHFGRYDASLGISHLCDGLALLGAAWQLYVFEAQTVERVVGQPLLAIFARHLRQLLSVVAVNYPRLSHARQTLLEVNLYVGVGEWTARVVDVDRSVGFGVRDAVLVLDDSGSEVDLRHAHSDVREELSLHVCFLTLSVGFVVLWHKGSSMFFLHPSLSFFRRDVCVSRCAKLFL